MTFRYIHIIPLLLVLSSCTKNIEVELPDSKPTLVVEGSIETGQPPYVILTMSQDYFSATDLNALAGSFVHNAVVSVKGSDGQTQYLEELCMDNIPLALQPLAAQMLGIPVEQIGLINYCIYTVPLNDLLAGSYMSGAEGITYQLSIRTDSNTYTASTKLPDHIDLDSTWFVVDNQDTLGYIYARLSDPDTLGNAYRWYTKRISHYFDGSAKDQNFLAPFGSTFEDRYVNGKSFEFGYNRPYSPSASSDKEPPGEAFYFFKKSDTVVVKFCSVDLKTYRFIRAYEAEVYNNGNPFASPTTIPDNISGDAIGLWAGYGPSYDTVYGE